MMRMNVVLLLLVVAVYSAENGVGRTVGLRNAIQVNRYKPTMRYETVPIDTITEYEMNDENPVTANYHVLVQGCPHPTVTWWKEDENGRKKITGESSSIEHGFIIRSERYYSCYTDTIEYADNSLEIYGFKKSDFGTYVAKAENSLGIVELKFITRLDTD